MKFTVLHNDKNHQLHLSTMTLDKLVARITEDDARHTVTRFREAVPMLDGEYHYYNDMPTWRHVCPAAEFSRDANGNLKPKACNGILLLHFCDIPDADSVEHVKQSVAMMPSTLAALTGADGRSVEVLVCYASDDGKARSEEDEQRLYALAYRQISPAYKAVAKATLGGDKPSLDNSFLMTVDPHPFVNRQAMAMRVDCRPTATESASLPEADQPQPEEKAEGGSVRDTITRMMQLLTDRYEFRFNTVMQYAEYRERDKSWHGFQPVEPRVQKRMTLEVQLADLRVSIKDVRNFLESDFIPSYSPVDEYLAKCYGTWDGRDHIRALARTVPTKNALWADWFYTWFLAMVDQWVHPDGRRYGNSVAPLLISRQGYNKSTFCRRLLPPELQWGYNDNLVLTEKRQVYQAMSQFLLVNLDEFNQISPQVQQGFLKNLIQLPSVKIKRPYGSHVEEFPRLASFIATSNLTDILVDPSGNRRFIGVELTGPIDVSTQPNHCQLFAQALTALAAHEKAYFDDEQVKLIMRSNTQFEMEMPAEQYFRLYFEATDSEQEGEYLTTAEIFDYLKKRVGSSLHVSSMIAFGRKLANIPTLKRKRSNGMTCYLVKKR